VTQSGVDVGFADRAMPTQLFENLLKLVAELWKHKIKRGGASIPDSARVSRVGFDVAAKQALLVRYSTMKFHVTKVRHREHAPARHARRVRCPES
jgi:hypothetical protein